MRRICKKRQNAARRRNPGATGRGARFPSERGADGQAMHCTATVRQLPLKATPRWTHRVLIGLLCTGSSVSSIGERDAQGPDQLGVRRRQDPFWNRAPPCDATRANHAPANFGCHVSVVSRTPAPLSGHPPGSSRCAGAWVVGSVYPFVSVRSLSFHVNGRPSRTAMTPRTHGSVA
jgi:hypothetical protein